MNLDEQKVNFYKKKVQEDRVRFDRMTATESILDLKYQTDSIAVTELLTDWISKAKNDNQKKILTDAILSMMRINSYVSTLQTVSKDSTLRYIDEKLAHNKLVKESSILKAENEKLNKMIKDYESGRF